MREREIWMNLWCFSSLWLSPQPQSWVSTPPPTARCRASKEVLECTRLYHTWLKVIDDGSSNSLTHCVVQRWCRQNLLFYFESFHTCVHSRSCFVDLISDVIRKIMGLMIGRRLAESCRELILPNTSEERGKSCSWTSGSWNHQQSRWVHVDGCCDNLRRRRIATGIQKQETKWFRLEEKDGCSTSKGGEKWKWRNEARAGRQ